MTSIRSRWKSRHTVLCLCIGSYFTIRYAQIIIGPLVPWLLESFTVTRGDIGIVLTGMWIAYAISQLPSGVLSDVYGPGRIIRVAVVMTGVATIGLALAWDFIIFALFILLLGVGAGIYYNPATAYLDETFEHIGSVIGTHRIGGQVAGVVAPVIVTALALSFGWRIAIVSGAAVSGLTLAVLLVRLPITLHPNPRRDVTPSTLIANLRTQLTHPGLQATTGMMIAVEFVGLATMAFLPIFLIQHAGVSPWGAGVLFALYFGMAALCQPVSGIASDRFGRDLTLLVLMVLGTGGFILLVFGSQVVLVVTGVVAAGMAMSATPVIQSRFLDRLPATDRGAGFGSFRTIYMLLGSSGTAVTGIVADLSGWIAAFGLLGSLLGVVLVAASLALVRS